MNILIFGTSNTTSMHLIKQAVQEGHYVTAFLPPGRLYGLFPGDNLDVISGDLLNYTAVEETMQGQEIVIDVLDIDGNLSASFFLNSACNIIKAMNANKVNRLIVLSKIGADNSLNQGPFLYRLWLFWMNTAGKKGVGKLTVHEEFVRRSALRWTIVRTVAVTEKNEIKHGPDISHRPETTLRKSFITATALTNFLLTIAVKQTYINEIIGISGK